MKEVGHVMDWIDMGMLVLCFIALKMLQMTDKEGE